MPLYVARPQPIYVRKTADESVTSSIALQADNHLFLPVSASAVYTFGLFLIADGPTAADLEMDFTFPAGATLHWTPGGGALAATSTGDYKFLHVTGTTAENVGLAGVGTKVVVRPEGRLRTAGTAGTLQFRWAQHITDAAAVTIYTDSDMTLRRTG